MSEHNATWRDRRGLIRSGETLRSASCQRRNLRRILLQVIFDTDLAKVHGEAPMIEPNSTARSKFSLRGWHSEALPRLHENSAAAYHRVLEIIAGGTSILRSSGERGIAGVARSISSVERRWVRFIQSGSELQPSG